MILHIPFFVPQVVTVEQLLGMDCDEAAEEYRLAQIRAKEMRDHGSRSASGGQDAEAYYEQLEANVKHE